MDTHDLAPFLLQDIEFDPGYSLLLTGWSEVMPVIQASGREGNGYTWDGVARLLVARHLPEAADQLEHDSESGMFAVYSSNRQVLEALAFSCATCIDRPSNWASS
ncbi:Imm51 family immunity protein [Streptomyces mirabilis]|uniref:Imm51 family immunity protein n=1 Tax=Streptomyces mirabilis TaxID=68239 RepID=A0ABU3V4Y0_9ACTN|nr:Imm51 family immunity protein [Streptomyces mirabilis]MCX5355584.1 immunity 51 family protein [Streptomyces mirabilis]MDU9001230.1 Imm51 family immunity protein [Streptomyces mirabilis]